jgi:hypothetical protein
MFGCSAADAVGQPIERFIPHRFRAVHAAHIQGFAETGDSNRSMGTLGALWALRESGEEFPLKLPFRRRRRAGSAVGIHAGDVYKHLSHALYMAWGKIRRQKHLD